MVLPPECLVANITFVGALVGVCALVYEQVIRLGELASAEAADEFCSGFEVSERDSGLEFVLVAQSNRSI